MRKNGMRVGAVRSVRLRGVGFAAKALGVHATHLRLVVRGERESKTLLGRVREEFPSLLATGGKTWREAGYE